MASSKPVETSAAGEVWGVRMRWWSRRAGKEQVGAVDRNGWPAHIRGTARVVVGSQL